MKQPMDRQRKTQRTRSAKPGTAIQRAIAAYRTRDRITVAAYLAQRGASTDLVRRMQSAVGRAVANAYRAATGSEPEQSGWTVARGRLMPVFAYRDRALLARVVDGYELSGKSRKAPRVRLLDLIGA